MLEKFIKDRQIQPSTAKGYRIVIDQYTSFHKTTINDLILEAWNDESENLQMYERRLPSRIHEFRDSKELVVILKSATDTQKRYVK